MTETTVEKITRNRFATIVCGVFVAALLAIIAKDFYFLFHDSSEKTVWTKIMDGIQFVGAFIALLWLVLIMIVSSITMSGPSFKKTCPYTVTFLIVLFMELAPRLWGEHRSHGIMRLGWAVLGLLTLVIVVLQMLAFSLDPHSSSVFASFRPFRIEVLTVIQLSNQAPPARRAERSSIV